MFTYERIDARFLDTATHGGCLGVSTWSRLDRRQSGCWMQQGADCWMWNSGHTVSLKEGLWRRWSVGFGIGMGGSDCGWLGLQGGSPKLGIRTGARAQGSWRASEQGSELAGDQESSTQGVSWCFIRWRGAWMSLVNDVFECMVWIQVRWMRWELGLRWG